MTDVTVFVIDDHEVVREGVRAVVQGQTGMRVIGESADGRTGCELVGRLHPDVVITDVSMAGLSGLQVTERLHQECPGVKVLVLTFHEDRGCLRQLLTAGAAGYLIKQTTAAGELVTAIRVVAAGGVYLNPGLAGALMGSVVQRVTGDGLPAAVLSEREDGVARLTAAGYSTKEIAARCKLSVKTVETYRVRAMDKLGLTTRVELVRYAARTGWFQDA